MSKKAPKDEIMYISAFGYNSPENMKPFVNRPPMRAIRWDVGKWDKRWVRVKDDGTIVKSKNYSRYSVRDFNTYEEAEKHYKDCVKRAIEDKERLLRDIQTEIKSIKKLLN